MTKAYPSVERVISYNILVLQLIKVKKADQAKVLSEAKLKEAIDAAVNLKGDIYDKAVILMKGLIQKHPFASGNRRTAFITVKDFVLVNGGTFGIPDTPEQARVMQGIREDYYTSEEIRDWINNGRIKEFKR